MLATVPTEILLDSGGLLSGLQAQSELTELLDELYYEALIQPPGDYAGIEALMQLQSFLLSLFTELHYIPGNLASGVTFQETHIHDPAQDRGQGASENAPGLPTSGQPGLHVVGLNKDAEKWIVQCYRYSFSETGNDLIYKKLEAMQRAELAADKDRR